MPIEPSRDYGHGEGLNGGLAGHDQGVWNIRNGKDLLGTGVVGQTQVVDEVNAQNVLFEVLADHERALGRPTFVGRR